MRNYFILAAVLFLVVGCDSKKEQAKFSGVVHSDKDFTQAGVEYLQKGQVKEAIASFESAIKKDPKNPENYITLGQVYLHLKNPAVAADIFTIAANIDKNNGEAYYLLGVSKGLNGDRLGAIEDVKISTQIFMQNKDQDKMKRSLALLKSLSESVTETQSSLENDVSKTPEQVLGLPIDKMQNK